MNVWNLSLEEAMQAQLRLRDQLILEWDDRPIESVAGVDIHYLGEYAHAAIIVMEFPALSPIETVKAEIPVSFPYIPGLLAFREGPSFLSAWDKLRYKPDLVMFDGHGIAHPRGIGLASQMGILIGRPTIGVAKSHLYGIYRETGSNRGDYTFLHDESNQKQVIGAVLRTKDNTRPLYISPGHLIDVRQSIGFVMACVKTHRLPETTRLAHQAASGKEPANSKEDVG
jgi:deoxyribonuclease V